MKQNLILRGLKGLQKLNELSVDLIDDSKPLDKIHYVTPDLLIPGKFQPRKKIKEESLKELAESIKIQGIIQPLIVRTSLEGKYEIIAGERRWRAAVLSGLTKLPVIIREIEDQLALAFALIENIQRENLNPMEEAMALLQFKLDFKMSDNEIAKTVGRSRAAITNQLRLLKLANAVQIFLEQGLLSSGHARALLSLTLEEQKKLAEQIVHEQLTVRQTEQIIKNLKAVGAIMNANSSVLYSQIEKISKKLNQKFSTEVSIRLNNKGTGNIIIPIASKEHLLNILLKLENEK